MLLSHAGDFYKLTKPGIIRGNLLTAVAGFLLGSQGNIDTGLLVATAIGTALIIASAAVFNNIQDQDIDAKMLRTRSRPTVTGEISDESASVFGGILGILGALVLLLLTSKSVFLLGALGWASYVLVYTPAKKRSVHATILGTIPGATPITAGFVAASGSVDLGALLLFSILVLWQLPHFYAISIFRKSEYAAAGVPVMSVVRGVRETKQYIVLGIAAFTLAVAALALYGYASFTYFVIMLGAGAWWLWIGVRGVVRPTDDTKWALEVFKASLLVLLVLSLTISVDVWLP